jgi:hypothetical protein
MKFLVEFNPTPEVKNAFEKNPEAQKKLGELLQKAKPIAGWFTYRRGFFVIEANNPQDLEWLITGLNHGFKTDVAVSPAISLEEFGATIGRISEIAKQV